MSCCSPFSILAFVRLIRWWACLAMLTVGMPAGAAPLTNGGFEGAPFLTGWTNTGVVTTAGLNGSANAARLPFNTTATLSQTVDSLTDFTFDCYIQVAGSTTAQSFRILLDSAAGNAIEVRGALGNIIQVNHLGTFMSATTVAGGATFPIAANSPVRIRVIGRNFGSAAAEYDLVWSNPGSTVLAHAAPGLKSFVSNAAAAAGGINRLRFDRNDAAAHSHWVDDVTFTAGAAVPPAGNYQVIPPAPPVPALLPVLLGFGVDAGPFSAVPAAEWTVTGGAWRNTITGTVNTSVASFFTEQLGGDVLTAPGFFLSSKFTILSSGNAANTVGFGLFGTNRSFSGGVTQPYYQIDIRPGNSGVRVLRVGINTTQFLPETALEDFTLNPALPFSFEVAGRYENGVLLMTVTTRQGGNESSFFVSDSEPLAVGWFGYRNRTNGGALTVDCDDFVLRRVSTIRFAAGPAPFARAGQGYASTVNALSDVGDAVTLTAVSLPAWLTLAGSTLSGTPGAGDAGAHRVTLLATDGEGGRREESFQISVLEPAGVMISEFLAENDSGLRDEDGDQPDWIELLNAGDTAVDLSGWWLSDDPLMLKKWALPAGTTLAPKGFLVVFASEKNRTSQPLHTNFKLGNLAGNSVSLANPAGTVVSAYPTYGEQRADRSYGVFGSYTPKGYLLHPTPGTPNDAVGYSGFTADVKFSVPRGIYTTPQSVTLTCATPGAVVTYTMDGSTPGPGQGVPASLPVTLTISTTTVLRAVAVAPGLAPNGPDTQSYFLPEDIRSQGTPAGWPTGKVNGQVMDYGMDPDITGTVTAQQMKSSLTAIPTLSLVTDLSNLLDPERGIYVNPYGREDFFECPVSVELLNPDASPGFHINAGLRIRGGASREGTVPKHNFHLYFRGEYGASKLNFPLFGEEGVDAYDRVDLRTAQVMGWAKDGSTVATYTRDEWNRATHGAMGQPYTRSRYYHLYLNGVYWGIFGTQERADADFAASYFGGSSADYDVMKTYVIPHRVEEADGDALAWTQLFNAATAGFAGDAAYFAVQGRDAAGLPSATLPLVDVDNLIDYTLLRFYAGDDDAPVNTGVGVPKNFYAIRPRDGRFGFRFFTHDAESCMRSASPAVDVTGSITTGNILSYFNPRWLSQQFAANAKYRLRFADRAQRHLFNGGALDNPVAIGRWRAIADQVSGAMLAESARWGDAKSATPRTVADWSAAVSGVETGFIATRRTTLLSQLRSRGLFPALDAPGFSTHGGMVAAGTAVTIAGPAGTLLFHTVNGQDPADAGGLAYAGPVILNGTLITLKARARSVATGEWSALTEARFTIGAVPASAENLTLSEIHYNPPGQGDETEFIELVNRSAVRVDLTGVRLGSAVVFTFGNMVLEPGGRVVVVEDDAAFLAMYGPGPVVAGKWTGALNNTSDTVVLISANGTEIERVSYAESGSWPVGADGGGYSLVRSYAALPAADPGNWRLSVAPGGNPGTSDQAAAFTGDPLADADQDGLAGLMEHLMGTSDLAATPSPVLAGRTLDGHATLTLNRRLAADDVRMIVETSQDLVNWLPEASRTQQIPMGGGMVVETWTANTIVAGRQFLRVKLTRN